MAVNAQFNIRVTLSEILAWTAIIAIAATICRALFSSPIVAAIVVAWIIGTSFMQQFTNARLAAQFSVLWGVVFLTVMTGMISIERNPPVRNELSGGALFVGLIFGSFWGIAIWAATFVLSKAVSNLFGGNRR